MKIVCEKQEVSVKDIAYFAGISEIDVHKIILNNRRKGYFELNNFTFCIKDDEEFSKLRPKRLMPRQLVLDKAIKEDKEAATSNMKMYELNGEKVSPDVVCMELNISMSTLKTTTKGLKEITINGNRLVIRRASYE